MFIGSHLIFMMRFCVTCREQTLHQPVRFDLSKHLLKVSEFPNLWKCGKCPLPLSGLNVILKVLEETDDLDIMQQNILLVLKNAIKCVMTFGETLIAPEGWRRNRHHGEHVASPSQVIPGRGQKHCKCSLCS